MTIHCKWEHQIYQRNLMLYNKKVYFLLPAYFLNFCFIRVTYALKLIQRDSQTNHQRTKVLVTEQELGNSLPLFNIFFK